MGKGVMIAIGVGKPKGGGSKGMADDAFADYMREKGGKPEAHDPGSGEEKSTPEEAGRAAAEDFDNASKTHDPDGIWDAFKRMSWAAAECSPPELAEDDDEPDDDDEA